MVNVNHTGVFFDWPNTVTLQSGSRLNINNGGRIQLLNLVIDNGATLNINAGGILEAVGATTNNSSNVSIDGSFSTNGDMTNDGAITGSGSMQVGGNASGSGTVNGTDMGDIDWSSGPVVISSILPVELTYFDATLSSGRVLITWETASEINNDYFLVERSSNGFDFELLDKVEGQGTSDIKKDYHLIDAHPLFGLSYYRLTQVDFDGKSETFEYAVINNKAIVETKIFPNPTSVGELNLIIDFMSLKSTLTVMIYDNRGQLVLERMIEHHSLPIKVPTPKTPGQYLLTTIISGKIHHETLIVK